MKYRAWGAVSQASYGNGSALNLSFDTALRPTHYAVTQSSNTRGSDYEFYNDGSLKLATDLSVESSPFDKLYKYDQAGRLREALSGFEARGETSNDIYPNRPYKQRYEYDAFNNRTGGEQKLWRTDLSTAVQQTYVNDRPTDTRYGSGFDADGRPFGSTLDAAGKPIEHISPDIVGGYDSYPRQPALEIRHVKGHVCV